MQIAAVASAVGLAGTAIANDMDDATAAPGSRSDATVIDQATPAGTQANVPGSDNAAGTSATSDLSNNANGTAGTSDLSNDATGTAPKSDLANPPQGTSSSQVRRGDAAVGATQGSTMRSPQGASTPGTADAAGHGRLAGTNSSNFNAWASDYAAQHNGRITRDEFLDQMGRRFDELDTQQQGSLTPYQVQEILIVTPLAANQGTPSSGTGASGPTIQ
jgi:hypothetical protein